MSNNNDSIHVSENKEEVADIDTTAGEEDDAEAGVTLAEVLEEEDQLEEDCNAVLGPSDDKNCSYHLVCVMVSSQIKPRLT